MASNLVPAMPGPTAVVAMALLLSGVAHAEEYILEDRLTNVNYINVTKDLLFPVIGFFLVDRYYNLDVRKFNQFTQQILLDTAAPISAVDVMHTQAKSFQFQDQPLRISKPVGMPAVNLDEILPKVSIRP